MTNTKIAEIPVGETHRAHRAMLELRPDAGAVDAFAAMVDDELRPQGYRLIGVFDDNLAEDAVAVAGFRIARNLAWGRYLYVDDLVATPESRGRGHGRALMEWLRAEARLAGCCQLHLESGTQRHDAHRFYLASGMVISSFHFSQKLDD